MKIIQKNHWKIIEVFSYGYLNERDIISNKLVLYVDNVYHRFSFRMHY